MSNNDGAERYRGYNIIKRNVEGGVKIQVWEDDPNEKDPKNQWKRISNIKQENKTWREPPNDHIDPPMRIGSNEDRLRAQGKLPPTEWELENEYFKTLNYDYEKDQKYALEHNIKCEHPGCNWIAEARCLECLRKKMGDHWFCRPMVFIQHYHGPYAFSFERGKEWIHYNHDHAHEHERKIHPPNNTKWISLRDV